MPRHRSKKLSMSSTTSDTNTHTQPQAPNQTRSQNHQRRRRPQSKGRSNKQNKTASSGSQTSLYTFRENKWLPIEESSPERTTSLTVSLSLLTFNTWSSSPTYTKLQSETLLEGLINSKAEIICLQEVSIDLEKAIETEDEFRSLYYKTSLREFWKVSRTGRSIHTKRLPGLGGKKKDGKRDGCLVLIRNGVFRGGLYSGEVEMWGMDRNSMENDKALICIRIKDKEKKEVFRIVTSHYSSLPVSAHIRASQFNQSLRILNSSPHPKSKILLGDFNINTEEEFEPIVSRGMKDTSPFKGLRDGPTFGHLYPYVNKPLNNNQNEVERKGNNEKNRRNPKRIDRIYISKELGMVASERRFGDEWFQDENWDDVLDERGEKIYMSDHEGIMVTVFI